ncbi:hypothetical protein Tco_0537819 [Tanacetum coccineum]
MQEVVLLYNGLDVPTRQILDSRGDIPSNTVADAKKGLVLPGKRSMFARVGDVDVYSGDVTSRTPQLAAIQAQLNNLGREIKKVNEKVYAAQVGCEQCKGPHYTKDCPLKEEGKTLKEAYYTQFGAPFQGGGYRATALGFYQRNNANPSYQERRQSMEDTLSKFMSESAKRHEENSNLIKEIRASTDAAIRNQGASIKTLEIQIGQMSKVLQERGFGSLPSSTEANPRDQVKSISTIIEADSYSIRRMGSSQYAEKNPGSFTLPFFINNVCYDNALADLGVSVSIMPLSAYLNLGLGELAHTKLTVELADKNTVLNRSLDPLNGDYIELNDLNVPLELRRDQVDDLMPTIEEGEVIEEFRTRDDELDTRIDDYPSYCDYDKKIRIDYAYNLKFSCMIDFAVLEDMDAYRDEGMGDVIFGEPFLREVRINAKWFEGMITIHNGNEEVTYQMCGHIEYNTTYMNNATMIHHYLRKVKKIR